MTISNDTILIGMPLKNGASSLKRAVKSVLNQRNLTRTMKLLILNDNSDDNWKEEISDYLKDPRVIIRDVNIGDITQLRNYILDYSKKELSSQSYIGRLDVDDYIIDEMFFSKLEKIIDNHNPDVIIAGNKLSVNDEIIKRINYADKKLLNYEFLKEKLFQMSQNIPEGELPSCNVFTKNSINFHYNFVGSAEDHWFTVDLLLNKNKLNIYIADDLLYVVYSLSGNITNINRKKKRYISSRQQLYEYFIESSKESND